MRVARGAHGERSRGEPLGPAGQLDRECGERRDIGLTPRPHYEVERGKCRKHVEANDLAQSALELVSRDARRAMFRYNETNARM